MGKGLRAIRKCSRDDYVTRKKWDRGAFRRSGLEADKVRHVRGGSSEWKAQSPEGETNLKRIARGGCWRSPN